MQICFHDIRCTCNRHLDNLTEVLHSLHGGAKGGASVQQHPLFRVSSDIHRFRIVVGHAERHKGLPFLPLGSCSY